MYIRKSNGLSTEPCGTPEMGLTLSERKPFTLTWITQPTCHFGGEVKHKNFMPESIVPNIVKSFFYVKKRSHYMFPSVEAFHNGLGKPEEMIISRLILSET